MAGFNIFYPKQQRVLYDRNQMNDVTAKPKVGSVLTWILLPENGPIIFFLSILLFYGIAPITISYCIPVSDGFYRLGYLGLLSAFSVYLGVLVGNILISHNASKILITTIDPRRFVIVIWIIFIAIQTVIFATATSIPIISALMGKEATQIALERELFLKARQGWESVLPYLNAVTAGALIPYSISLAFVYRLKFRWFLFAIQFLVSICWVEKAYFFKAVLPLIVFFASGSESGRKVLRRICGLAIAMLLALTFLAGSGTQIVEIEGKVIGLENYVTAQYNPEGALDLLVWRAFVVPILTAADSLNVHDNIYSNGLLYGATSGFIASVFGLQRIEFEQEVFSYQWGQSETGTGSANAVFFIEAFVNFGYTGLMTLSFFVGFLFSWISRQGDKALQSLWLLFAFGLFNSSLISMMLSIGFILVFLIALTTCWRIRGRQF